VPYEAFALGRAGDDRDFAKRVRKENRQERRDYEKSNAVQLAMQFEVTQVLESPEDVARWAALNELAETAPQRARERFEAYQADEKTAHAKLVADTWTAAFFWSLVPDAPEPPTFDTFYQVREKGRNALTEDQQRMIAALAEKHRFFHWHLAFPDVYTDEARGFDVILGNPPWEMVEFKELEFFADKASKIAKVRTSKRNRLIKQLPETDPTLYNTYVDAVRSQEASVNFLRESGKYPLTAIGRINTYQVFAGLMRRIVNANGRVGIVVPTGIATAFNSKDYFATLIENEELVSLYSFENREGIFPGVHRNYEFCLLTLTGPGQGPEEIEFSFFLYRADDLQDDERRFRLTKQDLNRINPNTKTCPIFRTKQDAKLTRRLYSRTPVLVNEAKKHDPWGVSFKQGLFNMASDSSLFHMLEELQNKGFKLVENCFSNENMCYLPLYEAKMMHQFEHRHATYAEQPLQEIREGYCRELQSDELTDHELVVFPRYWVSETEVEKRASDVNHKWFIGFRDVTRAVDKRTAQFAILPWSGIGHTVSLAFVDTEIELGMICAFLANFNSFTLDFIARQKMGGIHLSYYLVRQLPVLPPDRYTPELLRFIVPRVLELTYTAWDLQPFADDVWAEAREMGRKGEGERGGTPLQAALLQQWKANQRVVAPTPPPPPTPPPRHPIPPSHHGFPPSALHLGRSTAVAAAGRTRRAVRAPLRPLAGGAGVYPGDFPHRQAQGRGAVRRVSDEAVGVGSV
jgi:hypothetical protein